MEATYICPLDFPVALPEDVIFGTLGDDGHIFRITNKDDELVYYASQLERNHRKDTRIFDSELNIIDTAGNSHMRISQERKANEITVVDKDRELIGTIGWNMKCCARGKQFVMNDERKVVFDILPTRRYNSTTFSLMTRRSPELPNRLATKVGEVILKYPDRPLKQFGFTCKTNLDERTKLLIMAATFFKAYQLNGSSYVGQIGSFASIITLLH